jgi:hypothetical protein
MIFLADTIFLLSIFMITRSLHLQTLDILMIGLVVLSLILLAYQYLAKPTAGHSAAISAIQTLVAGIVALRFLVLFIGDLAAISSLLLYGAIIIFLFIAVSGVWSLVTGLTKRTSGDQVPAASAIAVDDRDISIDTARSALHDAK